MDTLGALEILLGYKEQFMPNLKLKRKKLKLEIFQIPSQWKLPLSLAHRSSLPCRVFEKLKVHTPRRTSSVNQMFELIHASA